MIKSGIHPARGIARACALCPLDRSPGKARGIGDVAEPAMVCADTLSNIKKHCFDGGLERALHDPPRPGAVSKIDGEVSAHLVTLPCSEPPEGPTRGTLHRLTDKLVTLKLVDSIGHVAAAKRWTNGHLGGLSTTLCSPRREIPPESSKPQHEECDCQANGTCALFGETDRAGDG